MIQPVSELAEGTVEEEVRGPQKDPSSELVWAAPASHQLAQEAKTQPYRDHQTLEKLCHWLAWVPEEEQEPVTVHTTGVREAPEEG